MPIDAMKLSSFSTMRSIGTAISPFSAALVRPICRWRPRLRSDMIELRHVAATPSASTDTCAPPLVMLAIAPAGSSFDAFTVATAPSSFANASFSSVTSTAMTFAPMAVAICTAESPTPPQPCTATHSPGITFAWSTIAWNEVMKRQPMLAASTKPIDSGSSTRLTSAYGTPT